MCECKNKLKFKQASNHCKRVLEAAKLTYANKIKKHVGLSANYQ